MTDVYLGIDPGAQNCALVAFSPTRGIVLTWKPGKDIPSGVRRLSYLIHGIKQQLKIISDKAEIKAVAIEGYSMFEKYGQHASGEVGGAIKLALVGWFGLDNPTGYPIIVAPGQLKKFTTGKGTTPKSVMSKEVFKRWGYDTNDSNLADAYALARVAWGVVAEPDMTAFQRDVVKALKGRTEWPTQVQSLSGSQRQPARADSPTSSPTPSPKERVSSSEPLGRWHLIRRSRPQPSASAS